MANALCDSSSGRLVDSAFFKQCLLSVCASLALFCLGFVRGFSAPGLPSMRELNPELLPSTEIESWIGSIPPFGGLFGSIIAWPLMHHIGRKRTVLLTSPIWTLAWLVIACAGSWWQLVLGRFLSGIGAGLSLPSVQIYVSESCDARTRGIIGSFPSLFCSAGILVAYILGGLLTWQQLAWVSAAASAALCLAIVALPESPVWLMSRGRTEEAQRSREWLGIEMTESQQKAMEQQRHDGKRDVTSWRLLFTRPLLMPTLVGLTLLLIQQVSGIDAVIFFTVKIFRTSGSSIDSNLATIIVGVVQLASNTAALFVVDRAGRKPLLIVSGVVMCIAMAFMGLAYHLHALGNTDYGYIPIISLIVFMIGFSVGFGSIPFLLMGEIFPAKQRGMLSSIAIAFNLIAMFTVIKTYHDLVLLITAAGTFWMYSAFCALGVVFVIFCVPETKGRDLDEMALVFRKSFRVLAGKSRNRTQTSQKPSGTTAAASAAPVQCAGGVSNEAFSGEVTKC